MKAFRRSRFDVQKVLEQSLAASYRTFKTSTVISVLNEQSQLASNDKRLVRKQLSKVLRWKRVNPRISHWKTSRRLNSFWKDTSNFSPVIQKTITASSIQQRSDLRSLNSLRNTWSQEARANGLTSHAHIQAHWQTRLEPNTCNCNRVMQGCAAAAVTDGSPRARLHRRWRRRGGWRGRSGVLPP